MTDQTPSGLYPAGSLRISPSKNACLVRYIDSPDSSELPGGLIYQRRSTRGPSLRIDTQELDQAKSSFALLTDSATRFQLPKISPLDFGPHESALTEEELSNEELESDNRSDTARDSSSLISDLLGHLEEEAALFPGPTLQATFTSSSSRSVFYSVGEETEFDTETDGLSGESGHFPLTPVDSPPLEVDVPGCTLSQSYQELVQNIPLDTTSETVLTRNDSLDRQSVDSFTFDAGLEVDLPITPKRKQRKNNPATSVLSPSFLGPFPTPFSHRQFIASSPSGSLRSPSASSVRDPTSLSPTARPSLKRRDTTRPRLHLSDIFKNRQASNKL